MVERPPRRSAFMATSRHPIGIAGRRSERLAIIIAMGSLGVLGFSTTSPILPDLRSSLAVSEAAIGWVQGAVAIPGIVFSVLIGYMADRLGRRQVALASSLLFGLFGAACYFARSLEVLLTLRVLQGLGMSGILGFGVIMIGDYFDEPVARIRALGLNQTGLMLAAMVGPIVAGALASGGRPFRAFLVFLAALPLTLWLSRLPPDSPRAPQHLPWRHLRGFASHLRSRSTAADYLGVLALTFAVVAGAMGIGLTVVPLFLDSAFGVPVIWRGMIVATLEAGGAAAGMLSAQVVRGLGTKSTISLSLGLLAAGAATIGVASSPVIVAGGMLLMGVAFGLFIPPSQSFASSAGGPAFRGISVGIWVSANRLAQTAIPPAGSAMSERGGARLAMWVTAGTITAAAVTWRVIRRWAGDRLKPPPTPIHGPGSGSGSPPSRPR